VVILGEEVSFVRMSREARLSAYGEGMRRFRSVLQRHSDVLVAVGFGVLMTVDLLSRPAGRQLPALAYGLLATLALAGRRRQPLLCYLLFLAGMVGLVRAVPDTYDTSATALALSVFALFSLGAHAVGIQFWLSIPVVCLTLVLAQIGDGSPFVPSTVMFFVAFAGTPWASGVGLRLYRERRAGESSRTDALLAEESTRNLKALEAERSRIARDLHDVVSHSMAVTLMQARGGRQMLATDLPAARAAFDAIERTNTQALGDMRRLLNVLREAASDTPTAPAPSLRRLPELIADIRASGVPVDLQVDGDLAQVPPGVDLSAYRVIQEALTNVIKHAGPARAAVTVRCSETDLALVVSDNGRGSRQSHNSGHGLAGIQERVAVLGGIVDVSSAGSGAGFAVRATLPYEVPA
jgi:signal transduction histidine kinase